MSQAEGKQHEERIAVVFIHGQGQQSPMVDVQELARTMWDGDPNLRRHSDTKPQGEFARTFTVPDARLGGADFARVTTESGHYTKRLDFFELYWANLMKGNRLDHLLGWFIRLQRRPRDEAPIELLPIRQFAIRACETVLIVSLLAAYSAALLIPSTDGAPFAARLLKGAYQNVGWYLAIATLALIVVLVCKIGWNEATAGAQAPPPRTTPETLRDQTKQRTFGAHLWVWGGIGIFIVVFGVSFDLGPRLDPSDMVFLLLGLSFLAALLVVLSRKLLETGTAIALIAGLLGSMFAFTRYSYRDCSHLPPLQVCYDHTMAAKAFAALPEHGQALCVFMLGLGLLAGLWLLLGIWRKVATLKDTGRRVGIILGALIVAMAAAFMILKLGWIDPDLGPDGRPITYKDPGSPLTWIAYSLSITLWITVVVIGGAFWLGSNAFLVPVMADAARYFSRDPEQIEARQYIRAAGVKLLDDLHQRSIDGEGYDRVIIVAHSLGSVVGYELLMDYWARRADELSILAGSELALNLAACEAAAMPLNIKDRITLDEEILAFRETQTQVAKSLRNGRRSAAFPAASSENAAPEWRWLITDFITVGSPLIHASTLMTNSVADFRRKKDSRELSTCPPSPTSEGTDSITFTGSAGTMKMVHSAAFCAVRWTNLFFEPGKLILEGDPISGPIAGQFGRGIQDVKLNRKDTGSVFAHNEYWRSNLEIDDLRKAMGRPESQSEHLVALKAALALAPAGQTTATLVRKPWRPPQA